MPKNVKIENEVTGLVVVGGYSKIAAASIIELKKEFPNIELKQFMYLL